MEFEEFLRHICEYVDKQMQSEMPETEDFFDKEFSELEKEFEELEEEILKEFDEVEKLIDEDICCRTIFNTLKRTVQLCQKLQEEEVPEEVHKALFEKLDLEDQ